MEVSLVLSSPRVAPRSVIRTLAISSTIFATVSASDSTAAVLSHATTVEEVIAEIAVTRMTERGATRGDDKVSDAAMEDRKKEGYF